MSSITYLMHINNWGDIMVVRPAKGVNPAENSTDENGYTVKYYYYDINNMADWVSTHYWDYDASNWVSRDGKPNKHAYWADKQWRWDAGLLLNDVRTERNTRLQQSDWTQGADSPLTAEKKAEWATYRTTLRDVPANVGTISSVDDVTWPTKPS